MAKEEFKIDDRMDEVYTGSGGRQSLQMPPGLELFKPKKSGAFRIEAIPFKATAAVNRFVHNYRFTTPGAWHWNAMYRVHGGVGPDNSTVVCSYGTYGKPCPICEQKAIMKRSADKQIRKDADAFNSRERQLLLVAEKDDRSGALGPVQLWEVSTFCFNKQLQTFVQNADREDEEAYRRFWHPTKGMTMKVAVTDETMGGGAGNYSKFTPLELKPRKEPLPNDIFHHGFDLNAIVRERSYADVRQLFHGVSEEEDGDGDEDGDSDTPKGRTGYSEPAGYESAAGDSVPPPRKGKPSPEPDEDPEPDADDEPTPVPKKATAKAPPPSFEVDDLVQVEIKGKTVGGKITEVDEDRQIARVKVPDKDKPATFDFDEMTPVHTKPDADEDEAPPPKKPAAKAKPAPEPEEDPEPEEAPKPKGKAVAAKAPAGWGDDDDDLPPPPKKKAK